MGRHILASFDRFAKAFEGPTALEPLERTAGSQPRFAR